MRSVVVAWTSAVVSGDPARVQPLLPVDCSEFADSAIQQGLGWNEIPQGDIEVVVDGSKAAATLPAALSDGGSVKLEIWQRDDGIWEVHPC